MKLYFLSDLHLELLVTQKGLSPDFALYEAIFDNIPATKEDYLLIGGDFVVAKHFHYFVPFLKKHADRFKRVFYLMGNHEYWHDTFQSAVNRIQSQIDANQLNITILDNQAVEIGDKIIWGSTLWYQAPIVQQYPLSVAMNDYRRIRRDDYKRVTYHDFALRFETAIQSLKETQAQHPNKSIIVATHHAPSEVFNTCPQGKHYPNVFGYGTALPYYDWNIACIIHGHSHIVEKQPVHVQYQNEWNIPSHMFTFGYFGHELFLTPELAKDIQIPYINLNNH